MNGQIYYCETNTCIAIAAIVAPILVIIVLALGVVEFVIILSASRQNKLKFHVTICTKY